MWLSRYPWPSEIMYDRGRELPVHKFKNILIEYEYGIITKSATAGNPRANSIIKQIHQVLANLVRTFELDKSYVDGDEPWKGIIVAAAFDIRSTFHTTNKKSPDQLAFGRDVIAPIYHVSNWRLVYRRLKKFIDKNTDRENSTRSNNHFVVGDQALIRNNQGKKYEAP